MIQRIVDENYANECDKLLTMLIQDERQYDDSIDENFCVKDYFKNIIKLNDHILLGWIENNNVCGYIYLKPINENKKHGYLIDGLFVCYEYRNKKIATKLIKESINILDSISVDFVDIKVLADTLIARKLYEKFGFKDFKIHMRK